MHQNTFINESFKNDIGYSLDEIPTIEAWYAHAYPDIDYRHEVINQWNLEEVISKKTGNVYVRRKSLVTCKKGTKNWSEIKASVVDKLHVVAFIDLDNEIRLQEALKNINSKQKGKIPNHQKMNNTNKYNKIMKIFKQQKNKYIYV